MLASWQSSVENKENSVSRRRIRSCGPLRQQLHVQLDAKEFGKHNGRFVPQGSVHLVEIGRGIRQCATCHDTHGEPTRVDFRACTRLSKRCSIGNDIF